MTLRAVDVLDGYLRRFPNASEAYQGDARFHLEITHIKRILMLVDMAMEDELVPEETRLRVLRTALYGTADPDAAMARGLLIERRDG